MYNVTPRFKGLPRLLEVTPADQSGYEKQERIENRADRKYEDSPQDMPA